MLSKLAVRVKPANISPALAAVGHFRQQSSGVIPGPSFHHVQGRKWRYDKLHDDSVLAAQQGVRPKDYWAPDWKLEDDDDKNDPITGQLIRRPQWGMSPEKWEYYNSVVWPPHYRCPDSGLPKKAEIYHCMEDVKYSPKKMWYYCRFILGRNVDDALKQLEFTKRKGSVVLIEALTEAKRRARDEANVEYPSCMHVAEAFPIQSRIIMGQKRHRGDRWAKMRYRYSNVFVRLEEGDGYVGREAPKDGWDKMNDYYEYLRSRRIKYPL